MIEQAKLEDKEEIYNLICILENKEINKEHFDSIFEILELVILTEKRSFKIGKQLIEKIEEIARNKKLEQIELSTSTYRKDAHRFYERQGYEKLHYNFTKELDD